MTDASTAQGHEPTEPAGREPFFPEEGAFNTVVPLSQVGRAPVPAEATPDDGQPAEADWALEDRRGDAAGPEEDESTLIPARGRGTQVQRHDSLPDGERRSRPARPWAVTTVVILLSALAGVAAGSYLVWSKRPVEVGSHAPSAAESAAAAAAAGRVPEPVTETPPPQPTLNATVTDGAEFAAEPAGEAEPVAHEGTAAEAGAKAGEVSGSTADAPRTPKPAAPPSPRPPSAEPAERRAAETKPRDERPTAAARETRSAPKLARTEAPAPRASAPAVKRPPRPVISGRTLPVSSPPPSARPRTVIQWP